MSNIQLNNLTKKYGSFNAVDSINLSIKNGEFVTLLGPSGCGKTTTLRMVAGFIKPTSGDLIIGGSNMVGVPPHNRKVGLVFFANHVIQYAYDLLNSYLKHQKVHLTIILQVQLLMLLLMQLFVADLRIIHWAFFQIILAIELFPKFYLLFLQ